jgi:hypothetical protein
VVARKKSSERWNSPAITSDTPSITFSTSCGTTPCSLGVADAWKKVEIDSSLDQNYLSTHSPEALIAVGLAMRAQGDK